MERTEEIFQSALADKKIPILTLDHKWHKLFTQQEYSSKIKDMECELNGLLKRQGKVNTKNREIRALKKKLMDEIVLLADEMEKSPTLRLEKEMETHKRLVNECNEKLEACEEEMLELPRQIVQLNNKLMLETMEVCYQKMHENTEDQLYSYMHDIFGAEVIEIFDMKYNPEEGRGQKKAAVQEKKETEETETENMAEAPES